MWWIEAVVTGYLGLAAFARANHRFRALPLPGGRVASPGNARLIGVTFLALTAWLAWHAEGLAHGLVAFACILAITGIPLVLLLSVRPGLAFAPMSPLLLPGSTRRSTSHH
jgi:hypothetical protein